MKRRNFFVLFIIIVILASFTTFFIIEKSRIVQVEIYLMDVGVVDTGIVGVNVDADGFHFGKLGRGGSSSRELMIKDVEEDVLVTIAKKGEIADWVSNPNNFIMKKGEERNITLSISIPADAPLGNYTGEAIITLRRY